MFALVQFPLADLRPFLSSPSTKTIGPNWKLPPDPQSPDFVRGFGPLRKRHGTSTGASGAWQSEAWFALAAEAIRLPDEIEKHFPSAGKATKLKHVIRRLFSDGLALWRLELGFAFDVKRAVSSQELMAIVGEILTLPVKVRVKGQVGGKEQLIRQRYRFAEALTASTTYKDAPPNGQCRLSLGRPMVLVETHVDPDHVPHRQIPSVRESKHLVLTDPKSGNSVGVEYATLRFPNTEGPMILLQTAESNRSEFVTSVRVHMCRLHAEREVLTQVLRASDRGKIAAANPLLEKYFARAQKNLFSERRFGIEQDPLRKIFDVYDEITVGEQSALSEVLQGKVQTSVRVAELVNSYRSSDNRVVINVSEGGVLQMNNIVNAPNNRGIINVAGTFINNGTIISQASHAELQQVLDKLNALSKELADELPNQADKESVALAAESIVKQALAAKPNKEVLAVTGKGLVEAAKTVAKMAAPIADAVKAVLDLIA